MSIQGNKWIDKTMYNLQEMLEKLVQANPDLENDPNSLEAAAFKTHPKAYIDGGLLELNVMDKLKIITTIKFNDLTSKLGREQIYEVVKAQINYYIGHPNESVNDAFSLWTIGEVSSKSCMIITRQIFKLGVHCQRKKMRLSMNFETCSLKR